MALRPTSFAFAIPEHLLNPDLPGPHQVRVAADGAIVETSCSWSSGSVEKCWSGHLNIFANAGNPEAVRQGLVAGLRKALVELETGGPFKRD